ncbi:MAG: type III secretion system inner membrane ring subunit SctD [Methylacidiphilaceae bacterium]|nr:type III secretion system inner membrane ring subunit SctD [Candidatus Methylacidiphilaceae bacterium]
MPEDSPCLLKIITGPHRGGQVELRPGEWVLGSSDENDIVLWDSYAAPRHLRLRVQEDGTVEAEALAPGVRIGKETLEGPARKLLPYQMVTVGSTIFAVGPASGTWPPASTPPPQSRLPAPTPAPTGEEERQPGEDETRPGKPATGPLHPRVRRLLWVSLAILFGGLALWGVIAAYVVSQHSAVRRTTVAQLLEDRGLSSRVSVVREAGGPCLQGYVTTEEELRDLESRVRSLDPSLKIAVWSRDQIRNNAISVLTGMSLPLRADCPEDGVVRVYGFLQKRDVLEKAVDQIRRDVSGVREVRVEDVIGPEEIGSYLNAFLERWKLDRSVRFTYAGSGITAHGSIPIGSETLWLDAKKALVEDLGGGIRLDNEVVVVSDREAANGLRVQLIVPGDIGWVGLRNGRKWFSQSHLPDGSVIEAILPNRVVIAKDGDKRDVGLGDPLWLTRK